MNLLQRVKSSFEDAHPNTMNEQLHDAFETYFPKKSPVRFLYMGLTVTLLLGFRLRKWMFGGRLLVNERIVEYPQILGWIRPGGSVLDIGCVSSRLPIQLASLGYEVHGLDVRAYPFEHPNFHFHQGDLFKWNPQQTFDTILLISTLEHFGIGDFGDLVLPDADKRAVVRIVDWLSPGGHLLVSVPFGKANVTWRHRIYDMEQLQSLFSAFNWIDRKSAYYRRINGHWMPSSPAELADIDSPGLPVNGVTLLLLEKGQ